MPKFLIDFIWSGRFGVQLFFVASAFTLFYTCNYRFNKEKQPVIGFFIRRFFRIAPLYYFGIILWTLIYIFIENREHILTYNLLSNIFFIHGINPLWINNYVSGGWSITVEMSFYLLIPLLFHKITSLDKSIKFFSICLLLSMALNTILKNTLFDRYLFLYYYLPNQLPVFSLGIISYFLVFEKNKEIEQNTMLLLFITTLLSCYFTLQIHVIFSMSFLILFVVLSKKEYPVIVNFFTCYVGKISYSIYIIHSVVFVFLQKINIEINNTFDAIINFLIRFTLNLLISIVVSSITYSFIEVPFQNMSKRILLKTSNFQKMSRL